MEILWICLALMAGFTLGFGTFALLNMSREEDEKKEPRAPAMGYTLPGGH